MDTREPTEAVIHIVVPNGTDEGVTQSWMLSIEVFRTERCIIARDINEVEQFALNNTMMLGSKHGEVMRTETPYMPEQYLIYRVNEGKGEYLRMGSFYEKELVWLPIDLVNLTEKDQNRIYKNDAAVSSVLCQELADSMRLVEFNAKVIPIGYHKVYVSTRMDADELQNLTI